ncbi:MAG: hypothetical protein COB54_06565 [Alphaproteobacteria bacterium]|nr:MAG: hypothetical protein COB54_06565 [Alphaproteobacteria bacterium]
MKRILLSISFSLSVVLISLSFSSYSAQAAARDFFKCKLVEGAKQEAMEKVAADFMKIVRKEKIKGYSMELLWPLYSQDISRGSFYWSGTAPNAAKVAGMEEFWGDNDANKDVRKRFGEIASCESSSIYMVSTIK